MARRNSVTVGTTDMPKTTRRVPYSKLVDELLSDGYGPMLVETARAGGGTFKVKGGSTVVVRSTSPRVLKVPKKH